MVEMESEAKEPEEPKMPSQLQREPRWPPQECLLLSMLFGSATLGLSTSLLSKSHCTSTPYLSSKKLGLLSLSRGTLLLDSQSLPRRRNFARKNPGCPASLHNLIANSLYFWPKLLCASLNIDCNLWINVYSNFSCIRYDYIKGIHLPY